MKIYTIVNIKLKVKNVNTVIIVEQSVLIIVNERWKNIASNPGEIIVEV